MRKQPTTLLYCKLTTNPRWPFLTRNEPTGKDFSCFSAWSRFISPTYHRSVSSLQRGSARRARGQFSRALLRSRGHAAQEGSASSRTRVVLAVGLG